MTSAARNSTGDAAVVGVRLEILRRKLIALAVEMSVQLRQTAQTPEINQERDYATAIVDRAGGVVATDNPLQLGALSATAKSLLKRFRFDMKAGDVVATNVPDFGGTRATDLALLSPVFVGNTSVLYFVVRARMPDLGGMVAGGFFPRATEMFAEAVPIPPAKLHREGKPVRDMVTTLLLNSRHPEQLKLSLDAMIAAMDMGRRRIGDLIGDYGLSTVVAAMEYAQSYVEKRARAEIGRWKPGTYRGQACLDHDGAGGKGVAVRVSAKVERDSLSLDFDESDGQVPSFVNSTISNTIGSALVAVLAILGEDIPVNEGLLRAVHVACSPGRLANALPTWPTGWSTAHCGAEITEATSRALRTAAATKFGDLTVPHVMLFGRPVKDRGARTPLDAWAVGGASAVEGLDGWGRPAVFARSILPSVEEWEVAKGIRIVSLEYATDSCGHGCWRGAPAVEAVIELPQDYVYTVCQQGASNTPQGVSGGMNGCPAKMLLESEAGNLAEAPQVAVEAPLAGKRLHLRRGGGAGFGKASLRDPQAVLADVIDALLTPATARSQYGVVLSSDGSSVDSAATARLRSKS